MGAEPHLQPKHRYRLQGVCTHYKNVYVCKSTPAASQKDAQEEIWWKFQYNNTPSISREVSPLPLILSQANQRLQTVELWEVLDAAANDSSDAILVYASDAALEEQQINIPDPLKTFVDTDNEFFRVELEESSIPTSWPNHEDTQPLNWDAEYDTAAADEEPPPYDAEDMPLHSEMVALEKSGIAVSEGVVVGTEEEWADTAAASSSALPPSKGEDDLPGPTRTLKR
jgi:hypothetical protein